MTDHPQPFYAGDITSDGVLTLIGECEELRTTGVLRYDVGDLTGEVLLVAGQFAIDQVELSDGRDPVEVLLGLREGQFELFQQLPALPVSKGDASKRSGSLAVHAPANLMEYCERIGLTGTLMLMSGDCSTEAYFECGELAVLRVEGTEDDELEQIFAWDTGTFEITTAESEPGASSSPVLADPTPADPSEREPTTVFRREPKPEPATAHSVQLAVDAFVEGRDKHRREQPDGPDLPAAQQGRDQRRRKHETVRVVFSDRKAAEAPALDSQLATGSQASAESRVTVDPPAAAERPKGSVLGSLAWVAVFALILLGSLALLAHLPPLE